MDQVFKGFFFLGQFSNPVYFIALETKIKYTFFIITHTTEFAKSSEVITDYLIQP